MTTPRESDPLAPALNTAVGELKEHLKDACTADDVGTESTAELMRLEDALTRAAESATTAVALRRRMREHAILQREGDSPSADDAGVRAFRDKTGRGWRVWAVTPGQLRPYRDAERQLGEYQHGWLLFESLDGAFRKRLPEYPADWSHFTEDQLGALLGRGSNVPERKSPPMNRSEESQP
ncbi:MAG: hypothetical protein NVS4B3_24800 [Gemmatimonadaceae bacterium]